ncbi:MAG: diacylglycerol/lipid kinase family protein [Nocardioidaceae bacterium]
MTRRLALLVNPASGRGRFAGAVDAVADRLASGGFQVTRMVGGDAAESAGFAGSAVADGYDALVLMGGDGLVHLALQHVVASGTVLGVIGTGTGNDVSRALGIPARAPLEAVEVVLAGETRKMDVGSAGGTYFATVLAAGFDSLVAERANAMTWPAGQMRYNLATLAELRVFRPIGYTLELDGQQRRREAMLVAVGNCPSYGGGIRICHGAEIDDGLLDVVVIKPVSKLELVKVYPRLFKGTHVSHPAYELHRVRSVTVDAPSVVAYADGERLAPLPVTVEVVPGAVTVFAPGP